MIFIWNAETAERVELMTLPKGCRSVSAIAFSSDSRYVAAADMSDDHAIHVFDLNNKDKKGKCTKIHTAKADRNKVFMIQWKPDSKEFISVGSKHLYYWTMTDAALKSQKGKMSSIKNAPRNMGFSSVAWSKKL